MRMWFIASRQQINLSDGLRFRYSAHSPSGEGVSIGGNCSSQRRSDLPQASLLLWLILAITGITVRSDGLVKPGLSGHNSASGNSRGWIGLRIVKRVDF